MKKKKILIASYNLDFGGIEVSLINLLKNLDLNKFKVTLVLEEKIGVFLNQIPQNIIVKEYKVSNNKNILLRKTINFFKRIKWLIFNYKKYDCSISYATYSGPCSFLARVSSNNKILFIHSNYYELYEKDKKKVRCFFDNLHINDYNHLVFVSNESKRDLINIYKNMENNSLVINNLVDYEKIINLSKEEIKIKIDKDKVITFVGRLDESSKRLTLLLNVAKKCKENKDKVIFWIIGSGPDEEKYKKIKEKENLNNVCFLGAKKNPYPYMNNSDYIILTSRYEGFPVVFNEAIILNKPIISTVDVTDDEIDIKNGFGYIVDKNNLYEELVKIINGKEEKHKYIDFNLLNKKRIKLIEQIMENNNEI